MFSVVIPTHNRLELLKDAMDSVLRQKYDNWELVVFDNCSTEDIRGYVESLKNPQIRYARSDAFLPVTDSWNSAIDLAKGDYVIFLGDDDGLAPGYFTDAEKIIRDFNTPDVLYSTIFQFMHPGVAPWDRAGYVAELKNAFFFVGKDKPFLLQKDDIQKAVAGSLSFRRNFTFNIQAFTFSRAFLNTLRKDGPVFHPPFPDYYLANVALVKARSIVAVPKPISITGVSRASFGFTLFNGQEQRGADMLNTNLAKDPCYPQVERFLLPGPMYNTSYIMTMQHIVDYIKTPSLSRVDFGRYRRLQMFSLMTVPKGNDWCKSEPGKQMWPRLSGMEKLGMLIASLLLKCGGELGAFYERLIYPLLWRFVNTTAFPPVVDMYDRGSYQTLPEVFTALENGTLRQKQLTPIRQ
jgi:glycosyltransferase involved in cell wall biosynthesis